MALNFTAALSGLAGGLQGYNQAREQNAQDKQARQQLLLQMQERAQQAAFQQQQAERDETYRNSDLAERIRASNQMHTDAEADRAARAAERDVMLKATKDQNSLTAYNSAISSSLDDQAAIARAHPNSTTEQAREAIRRNARIIALGIAAGKTYEEIKPQLWSPPGTEKDTTKKKTQGWGFYDTTRTEKYFTPRFVMSPEDQARIANRDYIASQNATRTLALSPTSRTPPAVRPVDPWAGNAGDYGVESIEKIPIPPKQPGNRPLARVLRRDLQPGKAYPRKWHTPDGQEFISY